MVRNYRQRNPYVQGAKISKRAYEALVSSFFSEQTASDAALRAGISVKTACRHYASLRRRLIDDSEFHLTLGLQHPQLPPAADEIWRAIERCLFHCTAALRFEEHILRESERRLYKRATTINPEHRIQCSTCPLNESDWWGIRWLEKGLHSHRQEVRGFKSEDFRLHLYYSTLMQKIRHMARTEGVRLDVFRDHAAAIFLSCLRRRPVRIATD